MSSRSHLNKGSRGSIRALTAALLLTLATVLPFPVVADGDAVRIAVLKYGTASWPLDVVKRRGLDQAEGFDLAVTELAGTQATLVALQSGDADVAVSDWLWVARQRAEGRPFSFVPFSTATGALMVPAESEIGALADLSGKRVGVAGGPLDKSWLMLRALSLKQQGKDLEGLVEPVFAAPPLLNEEIARGRIDAVLNYWPYAARLAAAGMKPLLEVRDARSALGVESEVPMVGYVFDERWAEDHRERLLGFFRAVSKAQDLLLHSDAQWSEVRPLMGADDDASFEALRNGYRAGIPRTWGETERTDAARLFQILREIGGSRLVGSATELPPGTFWPAVSD